jgi:mercuric ion transport protein
MNRIVSSLDKVGTGTVVVAALSCAACFPTLGALSATLGLGFLHSMEGVMLNRLLPLFALFGVPINSYAWYQHRILWRGILSVLGPSAILASLYPFWQYSWSSYLFYAALVLMLIISVMDFIKPAQPRCAIKDASQ